MNPEKAEALSPELQAALQPLLLALESLSEQIHDYNQRIEKLPQESYPQTALLKQVKGVGTLIALSTKYLLIAAIAELERNLIVERVRAGIRRAKLEGRHIGCRPLEVDRVGILQDRDRGRSLTQIAKANGISRTLVSRVIKDAGRASHKGSLQMPPQTAETATPESAA